MAATVHADPGTANRAADPWAPKAPLDDRPLLTEAEVQAFERRTAELLRHGRGRLNGFIDADKAALEDCSALRVFKKRELKARIEVWRGLLEILVPMEARHAKFTADYRAAIARHGSVVSQRDAAHADARRLATELDELGKALAALDEQLTSLEQASMSQRRVRDVAVTSHQATDAHVQQLRNEITDLTARDAATRNELSAAKNRLVEASAAATAAAKALEEAAIAQERARAAAGAAADAAQQQLAAGSDAATEAAVLALAVDMAEIEGGVAAFQDAQLQSLALQELIAKTKAARDDAIAASDSAAAAKAEKKLGKMTPDLRASQLIVDAVKDNLEAARRRHARLAKRETRRTNPDTYIDKIAAEAAADQRRVAKADADRTARGVASEVASRELELRQIEARLESAKARLQEVERNAAEAKGNAAAAEKASAGIIGSSSDEHTNDWWSDKWKRTRAERSELLAKRDAAQRGRGRAERLAERLEDEVGAAMVQCRVLQGALRDQLKFIEDEVARTNKFDHESAVEELRRQRVLPREEDEGEGQEAATFSAQP